MKISAELRGNFSKDAIETVARARRDRGPRWGRGLVDPHDLGYAVSGLMLMLDDHYSGKKKIRPASILHEIEVAVLLLCEEESAEQQAGA